MTYLCFYFFKNLHGVNQAIKKGSGNFPCGNLDGMVGRRFRTNFRFARTRAVLAMIVINLVQEQLYRIIYYTKRRRKCLYLYGLLRTSSI